MGLSDIPPPTTSCLKRSRSEDPSSFAELCSPPLKQPLITNSSPHLSFLQDLESSLNAVPTIEAAPTPEELVTEMMLSLEKVMGDLDEFISGSSDSYITCAVDPKLCVGNSLQVPEISAYDEPSSSSGAVYTLSSSSSEALNLCRDMAADCELACEKTTFHGCRHTASNCDLASAFGACRGDVNGDGEPESKNVCTEGCVKDCCIGRDSIAHMLDASDAELGLTHGTEGTAASTLATEQSDEHWNLVDELADGFALSAFAGNQINWLEEGCELPAFTFSQIEEEAGWNSVARENTELLLLDCYL